ncbi:MAG: hypothetical protein ACFFCS_05670 [Candidatus Hodarchaeota archaeon]
MATESNNIYEDLAVQVRETANDCKVYKEICEKQEYDFDQTVKEDTLGEIPYLNWNYFKESNERYHELLRIPLEKLSHWTISSSTTGDPSVVGRAFGDVKVFQDNYADVFEDYSMMSTLKKLILFAPDLRFLKKMPGEWKGKRGFLFYKDITELWQDFDIDYLLKFKLGKVILYMLTHFKAKAFIEIDGKLLKKSLKQVENEKIPALIANSVPLMYQNFTDYYKKHGEGFDMPETFRVQTGGGGWSGTKGRVKLGYKIDKGDFFEKLSDFFNIPVDNFADLFGATETPIACGGHWSKQHNDVLLHLDKSKGRLILRSPETQEPVKKTGEPGVMEFLTPYGVNSYAGVSVLLDDLAEYVNLNRCPVCGREGTIFRVVGKLTPELGKGCVSFYNLTPFKDS